MSIASTGSRRGLLRALSAALVAMAAVPGVSRATDQGLFLIGYNANFLGGMPMEQQGGVSSEVMCGPDGPGALQTASQAVLERVSGRLANLNVPAPGGLAGEARNIQAELCQGGAAFHLEPTAITYSSCRLTMDLQATLTDMRLPAGGTQGAMEMADFWKSETTRIPLYSSNGGRTSANEEGIEIDWTGPGDTRRIAGYPATRWDFKYATRMGIGGAGGMSVNMATDAHGYFSKDVPGIRVVEEFYRGFSQGVSFEQGGASFFGALMNTWVEVLARGLPLQMDQTMTSSMGGMGKGGGTRSVLKVTSLELVDLPADFCTRSLTPDYFEVTDAGQGLPGMATGPGGSAAGAGPTEGSGQSALGSLFEMLNSAQQQGYGTPASQPATAAGAPTGGAASARALPSSAELTTGDLTQSVQQHLQALGYETGNTDGELSTATIIAISQFQAERDMEVTGEVTPQLLGILGAAVDARR